VTTIDRVNSTQTRGGSVMVSQRGRSGGGASDPTRQGTAASFERLGLVRTVKLFF